jgi:hypothetical protein
MSHDPVPLTRLYLFGITCAAFATIYGMLDLEPAPLMGFLLIYGPVIAVAIWLGADNKHRRVMRAHDSGFFFYLTWPLTLPWYALRTRGRTGWRLAAQLYALGVAGQLGFAVGAALQLLLGSPSGYPA